MNELYLRGIYSYEQRTTESLKHSEEAFTEATKRDPNYAPAYAGLSNTYNLMREYSEMPDAEAYTKARTAAERALQLDPKLPQAHASLGFIDFFWSMDPPAAEREFKLALELDPSQALAHHWYGSMLTHQGRFVEALDQLNRAQRLQPTSDAILSTRALALGLSGHRHEATDQLQELINEAPSSALPHQILSILSLMPPRDLPRYLDESRRVSEMRNDTDGLKQLARLETAYRKGGETAMWKEVIATQDKLHPPPALRPYPMGTAEAALGNTDAAFAILLPLARHHDRTVLAVGMDPMLTDLRKDPRYAELLSEAQKAANPPLR